VIAVGHNDMAWNRTVLQETSPDTRLDYLSIHHYYGRREMNGDLQKLLARPEFYAREYDEIEALMREFPAAHRPKLAINEWGLDLPESQQYSILTALYAARLMHVFERHGDRVGMTSVSDLINGWPGGIIQASRHGLFVTPIYLVNKLYASHVGADRLSIHADTPTLDAIASRSPDGRTIAIKAINIDLERPLRVSIKIKGAQIAPTAQIERVTTESLSAINSFATPDAIHLMRESVPVGDTFPIDLPKHSVSVITVTTTR
jgi:alpha-L-arabinofuranosidase